MLAPIALPPRPAIVVPITAPLRARVVAATAPSHSPATPPSASRTPAASPSASHAPASAPTSAHAPASAPTSSHKSTSAPTSSHAPVSRDAIEPAGLPAFAAADRLPLIARGTDFAVELTSVIDSRTAQIGDRFTFRTVNEFRIGNRVVIPAGTPGVGVVTDVEAAHSHSHGGMLELSARSLDLRGGQHVDVILDRRASSLHLAWAPKPPPWFTRFVPHFGQAMQAFGYLRKGKNVELRPGVVFMVATYADTAVFPVGPTRLQAEARK